MRGWVFLFTPSTLTMRRKWRREESNQVWGVIKSKIKYKHAIVFLKAWIQSLAVLSKERTERNLLHLESWEEKPLDEGQRPRESILSAGQMGQLGRSILERWTLLKELGLRAMFGGADEGHVGLSVAHRSSQKLFGGPRWPWAGAGPWDLPAAGPDWRSVQLPRGSWIDSFWKGFVPSDFTAQAGQASEDG